MNRHRNNSARSVQWERRQSPLERMDEYLNQANEGCNAEIIRRLRQAMFADVDELQRSGQVKLPT